MPNSVALPDGDTLLEISTPEGYAGDLIAAAMKPFMEDLGRVVYAWNSLQEELAKLFWAVCVGLEASGIPLAIWHELKSDRLQRDVLRAAAMARNGATFYEKLKYPLPGTMEEIAWLLERANSLEDRRNNVVHATYMFAVNTMEMHPWDFFGNKRAKNLKAKNLKGENLTEELRLCRATAELLNNFSFKLKFVVGGQLDTLPERPLLPTQGQKTGSRSRPK